MRRVSAEAAGNKPPLATDNVEQSKQRHTTPRPITAAQRQRQCLSFFVKEELSEEVDNFWVLLGNKLDSIGTNRHAQRELLSTLCSTLSAKTNVVLEPVTRSVTSPQNPNGTPENKARIGCAQIEQQGPQQPPEGRLGHDAHSSRAIEILKQKSNTSQKHLNNKVVPQGSVHKNLAHNNPRRKFATSVTDTYRRLTIRNDQPKQSMAIAKTLQIIGPLPLLMPDSGARLLWDLYCIIFFQHMWAYRIVACL